ncbi:MAG: hypothetical protein ABII64_09610 [Elusimicrobiota bacterium]
MNKIRKAMGCKWGIIPLIAFFIFCVSPLISEENASGLKQSAELKNKNISPPSDFKKEYTLDNLPLNAGSFDGTVSGGKFSALKKSSAINDSQDSYAEVAVNILGPNFRPVRAYVLRDVTDLNNVITLWDGRDSYGRELPAGDYYAQLSVVYSDGKQETKTYKFVKK